MRKNDFPSGREWREIVDDAFFSDEDHVFSERYNMKKQQMLRRNTMKQTVNKKRVSAVVAAAVAVVAVIPATIYAYEKISAKIEKTAKYENTVTIQTPDSSDCVENMTESKYMYYEFGWLPEGYAPAVNNWGYDNVENGGRIAPLFYRLPDDTTLEMSLPFSEECENYQSGDKTAMINYRQNDVLSDNPFTREIFISFDGTSYLIDMSITNNISHEDLLKIIDNVKLVETDEKMYGDYIPWLDYENGESAEYKEPVFHAYEEDIRNVGDTISYPFTGEGKLDGYDVTLNSFEITDSFDGIHTDSCGWEADYSALMDENGNIIENIRSHIKQGDGVDTIDEVVLEESVPMHILKMNVTYTNTSDAVNDIIVSPIMFITKDGEGITHWEHREHNYRDSILGYESQSSFFSMETDSEHKGRKNHLILEPNESADVQITFFVAEDVKDKVNVSFLVSGNDFGEYFDVSQ